MIPLEPEGTYHIYNRANGNEPIFANPGNYQFFLQKYQEHLSPVLDTFCYCLMPNHFHLLVRIKTLGEIERYLAKSFPETKVLEKGISKRFSNFFSSYSQAFNKQQGRMGSLFMKNFKRKKVEEQKYLLKLVNYIHLNPVKANLCTKPESWPYSSYSTILFEKDSFLLADDVITWFENKENFIYCHSAAQELPK